MRAVFDFVGEFDVAHEGDLGAVECFGGEVAQAEEFSFELDLLFLVLFVFFDGGGVGVDDDDAGVAVDDKGVAGGDFLGDVFEANDGGDAHRVGDDRGVRRAAAGVDADGLDLIAVEGGGLRGGEVVGDEGDGFGDVAEADAFALPALEFVDEAAFDVVDVFDALAEVHVFLFEELLGVFAQRAGDGVLGGEAELFDALVKGIQEGRIIQQAEVEVEDRAGFLAEVAGGLVAEGADVGAGGGEGVGEAGAFGFDVGGGYGATADAQVVVGEEESLTDDHAGGDADAFFDFHEWAELSAARPAAR